MKKLLIIALLFIGCESDVIEPVQEPQVNAVFWTTSNYHDVQIVGMSIFRLLRNNSIGVPDCQSQIYDGCGYKIIYLKPGSYTCTIMRETFSDTFSFTIYDDRCNIFNCAEANGWR